MPFLARTGFPLICPFLLYKKTSHDFSTIGVRVVAHAFIELFSFPVPSSCRYSESSQPSAWQSDIPASLSSPDDTLHRLVSSQSGAG